MFTNTALIQTLNNALAATQSGATNKQGEQLLRELRENPQFPTLLFDYYQNQGNHDQLRLLASIQFQHWFKEYKNADDYIVQQYTDIISSIKQAIVQSYVTVNHNVGKQVEQAILFLAAKEFPHRWGDLCKQLMNYIDFNLQNNEVTLKVLKLVEKITDRYSYTMRSDELFTEIILVCDDCHDYLFKLIDTILLGIQQQHDTLNLVKILKFLMKIFYNLNYQDLHPKFEDNLANWMQYLSKVINIKVDPLAMGGHDITLFKAKGECLKAVLLYATRYREEFQELIQHFAGEIWNMCTLTDQDQKFDKIVINALKYFKNLVLWQDLGSFFKDNMQKLMEYLIIPNLGVTSTEKDQFEGESASFLESFFQFSDINTRKSVTVDLLKNISKGFPNELISQVQDYLSKYKQLIDSTGTYNIENEIVLLNLIIDGATVAYRDKEGVTEISLPAELITYVYENIIKPTLGKMFSTLSQNQNRLVEEQFNALHICYYLRFFYYFRNFINRNEILELTRIISFFLRSEQESLVGLTAITIEGLLNLKDGDLKNYVNVRNYFNKDNVNPQIEEILNNIYLSCKAQEQIDANLLKTLHYVINLLKEKSLTKLDLLTDLFSDQLDKLLKTGYDFQRASTLFECIGFMINVSSSSNQDGYIKLENTVSPSFNKIINQFIPDLLSFVLQTYSIIVRNTNDISKNTFKSIFETLINPQNWIQDNVSIFPAYIIYISAYIYRVPSIIVNYKTQLEQILIQFLNLKQDLQFFEFARIFITQFSLDEMRQSGWLSFYISTCINFYLELSKESKQITSKSKGSKPVFVKNFIVFIGYLIKQYSAQQIINDFNGIQQNVLIDVLIEELNLIKTISDLNEKKVIFAALMDILFNNTSAINLQAFASILNAIVENMGTRRYRPARYTEQRDNLNSMGGSGFSKLSCLKEKNTLIPEIQNLETFFGAQFNQFYNNPTIKSQIDMAQILNLENQKILSKIILSGNSN